MNEKPLLFYSVGIAKADGEECVSLTVYGGNNEANIIVLTTEGCDQLVRALLVTQTYINAQKGKNA